MYEVLISVDTHRNVKFASFITNQFWLIQFYTKNTDFTEKLIVLRNPEEIIDQNGVDIVVKNSNIA